MGPSEEKTKENFEGVLNRKREAETEHSKGYPNKPRTRKRVELRPQHHQHACLNRKLRLNEQFEEKNITLEEGIPF